MLGQLIITIALLLVSSLSQASTDVVSSPVKVTEFDLFDTSRQRPIKITVWYPAADHCEADVLCIKPSLRTEKLVVMSHGAMGSVRSMNWLGYAFASQDIVTIGINHFGESWVYGQQNQSLVNAAKLWQRPQDVSYVLDNINAAVNSNRPISTSDVIALGFSSGGSTALALGGATYDFSAIKTYCETHKEQDLGCGYVPKQEIALPAIAESSFKDDRIQKVIALDPAAGPLTKPTSLARTELPVLIVGLTHSGFLPQAYHAQYYHKHLPHGRLINVEEAANHFALLDKCELDIKVHTMSLCDDPEGVDRTQIQRSLYPALFGFIFAPQPNGEVKTKKRN